LYAAAVDLSVIVCTAEAVATGLLKVADVMTVAVAVVPFWKLYVAFAAPAPKRPVRLKARA